MTSKIYHIFLFSGISSIILVVNGCTIPIDWHGEWHDSSDRTQDITFTWSTNYVVGWSVSVYSSTITSWTCVDEDTSNNLLLFKSNQTVDLFGTLHDLYRCIKWEKLSDVSYSYVVYADVEINAQGKRVFSSLTSNAANASSGCNPSSGIPSAIETIILIKKGHIENAKLNCPAPFLGIFNYSLNNGSTTFCDSTSVWNVCTDQTQMVVNYTLCATKQFYSVVGCSAAEVFKKMQTLCTLYERHTTCSMCMRNGGVAYCAYSTSVGSNYYVTVVNADSTVDFTTTFRFTCYAVTSSGGYVYASDNKGACVQNQDPLTKTATGTGKLTLSAYETCSFSLDSAKNTSDDIIGIIAGSVAGVVILVAAVVAVILIYKKYKARVRPIGHRN